ncbi:phosphatase PAP2 family protein [Paenibacillus pasadenensis]|uniref:PAP2 family protein n=1 Tax=Paenibacillus pasadenensis TaxID=217090 RepID=A0A2N5N3W6_9BACL|nr:MULTISPECIES: phosphatase PAP2 family protein [Paenibacillus]PLT45010.1 PAP2 family protein [Paenibacillus pasadenensis]QGG55434.1 phosphatase PAP2 family protein [Paenibacillus sp. B01]
MFIGWLRMKERRLLLWLNRGPAGARLGAVVRRWLSTVTHMGGATFTLSASLLLLLLGEGAWELAGWQSLAAVVVSHIPVAVVKRTLKRLRPYQAIEGVRTGKSPLADSSFPSGHTTAVFAWIVPLSYAAASELPAWLPLIVAAAALIAGSVGWSRMYLGLHYPSDVGAGALLGTLTALLAISFIGS